MATKKSWAATEVAKIIAYADYCIYHSIDYQTTVTAQLLSRHVSYSTVRGKLERVFRSYGIKDISIKDFIARGLSYLDIGAIPSDVLVEINALRQEWGFAPLRARQSASEPSSVTIHEPILVENADIGTSISGIQIVSPAIIDYRPETPEVEETPKTPRNMIPATDGSFERPSVSPLTSPSELAVSPTVTARKRREVSPDDPDGSEYEPSPKSVKSKASSQDRTVTKAPKGPRGIATTKAVKRSSAWLPKTQATAQSQREASVMIVDPPPGDARVAAPSSQAATLSLVAGRRNTAATGQHSGKRNAELMIEEEDVNLGISPKRSRTGETTVKSVADMKIDGCISMIGTLITHMSGMSEETSAHLYQILRTLKDPNGSIVEDLIKDLDSQRALKAKYSDMIKKLVDLKGLGAGIEFPKEPKHEEVRQSWRAIFEYIVLMIGLNNTKPYISAASAAYLASSAENIAYGRIPADQLCSYIESLSVLPRSPHAQQTLFSALFCRYVFADPESMLHAMHSDGMMHLYNGILSSASSTTVGLSKVQQYDKIAARLLFQDPAFQEVECKRRLTDLTTSLQEQKEKLCRKSKIPMNKTPDNFAKEVIELKQQLLLSPKHYRIHYVRPNILFDAQWMQAYDLDNLEVSDAKAEGKRVVLCLFPALTCEKGQTAKDDTKVEDVLVKNKRFLPTFQEMIDFDPGVQLSKAMVLVVPDEEPER